MKTLITLISVVALGTFSSSLLAQEAEESMDMSADEYPNFATVDTDSDGFLSAEEIDAAGATISVEQGDTNDDSLISRIEYQEMISARSEG